MKCANFGFIIFWSFLGLILALVLKLWIKLDFNREIFNHTPGYCRHIEGIENGSHGIFILSNGFAIITSVSKLGIRFRNSVVIVGLVLRAPGLPYYPPAGNVYLYDVQHPQMKAERLQIDSSDDHSFNNETFRPGDITGWEVNEKKFLIYIVDTDKRQICVFDLDILGRKLIYMKSLSDPLLTNPNDLVALGENELYVSNFAHYSNPIMMNIELALEFPFGSIFHFNGSHFNTVLDGLNCPDGLALSVNKHFLYVTLLTGQKLLFHKINADKGLTEIMRIPTDTKLDNVYVDRMDRLWIASQPILYRGLLHILNPFKFNSPSQVIRITFHRKGGNYVEEVFADDGVGIKFASSVAVYEKTIIIGTLFDKALWCRLNAHHSPITYQIKTPPKVVNTS